MTTTRAGISIEHRRRWDVLRAAWRLARQRGEDDARPPCRWCLGPVPAPRRTFCSEVCIDEWRIRTTPAFARRMVFARDQGRCALCGADTEAIRAFVRQAWVDARKGPAQRDAFAAVKRRLALAGYLPAGAAEAPAFAATAVTEAMWEMDHVVPVAEGGGRCGLDNLRTLCVPCHRLETARLAMRLAQRRRTAGQLQLFGDQE